VYVANAVACDDGNRCTTGDTCVNRVCTGAPLTCDDAAVCTDDRCDPARGCVYANNTAPCDDADPATFADVCDGAGVCRGQALAGTYAVLCWPPASDEQRWVFLGGSALITGDVCAESIAIGPSSVIDGDVVAWESSGPAIAFLDASQVRGDVVTGGGTVSRISGVTVGGRVDVSGSGAEIAACLAARRKVDAWREQVVALPPSAGLAVGAARVRGGAPRRIPPTGSLGAGRIVVEARKLHLAPSGELTLVGTASTEAVIVRVRGRMEIGRGARITLEGLRPEQVVFVVDGSVILQPAVTVSGSVFATGRVMLGKASRVSGAILGNGIILAPDASVDLHRFVEW
jgi:cytoskeletal protein CcmA (bactofilin family)